MAEKAIGVLTGSAKASLCVERPPAVWKGIFQAAGSFSNSPEEKLDNDTPEETGAAEAWR
jgi:hypothetical protein